MKHSEDPSPDELGEALHPERAAFAQLMPIREGGLVLEIGADWGGITTELAKTFRVVALEPDSRRARFISRRATELGQSNQIEVRERDFLSAGLEEAESARYDAIVMHLPAAALSRAQLIVLRAALASGGVLFVGAENGVSWRGFRAALRTRRGYEREFAAAGFQIRACYVSPRGYRNTSELVPLQRQAIYHYTRMRLEPPGSSRKRYVLNRARELIASAWFWRSFAPDFVFFLGVDRA